MRPANRSFGDPDESFTGMRALKLDLSKLNSGAGAGKPTVQIIDEINNQFAPPPKVGRGAE